MFNPVGVQTQQAANEKTQSAEGMDATAELTLQGDTSLMCLNSFISSIHFYVSFFLTILSALVFISRHAECCPQWNGSAGHAPYSFPHPPPASVWTEWAEDARPAAFGCAPQPAATRSCCSLPAAHAAGPCPANPWPPRQSNPSSIPPQGSLPSAGPLPPAPQHNQ